MKRTQLTMLLICVTTGVIAQQENVSKEKQLPDSISSAAIDGAAMVYPQLRQFSITHQYAMPGNLSAKRDGKPLFDGRYQSSATKISMRVPVIEGRNTSFIARLGVVHQFNNLDRIVSHDSENPVLEINNHIPMISLGATFVHKDSLFNHPVIFTGSVNGLVNPSFSRRQITFTGLISTPIIQNRYTRLSGGLLINLDPSSPVPAFLLVNYFHKFRAMDIDLLVDAPYRVALRKAVKSRTSLSLQTELGGKNSFFEINTPDLPDKLTFSTLEIKSGLLFEYRFSKKMIFSLSGGALSTVTSKIFEQGQKPGDYLVKNKHATVPYAQFGISLLPFWRPFKK